MASCQWDEGICCKECLYAGEWLPNGDVSCAYSWTSPEMRLEDVCHSWRGYVRFDSQEHMMSYLSAVDSVSTGRKFEVVTSQRLERMKKIHEVP